MTRHLRSLIPEPEPVHEVQLATLPDGTRFCMRTPAVWGLPETRVYGELLWHNSSRCRVLLAGQQKQVVFGDGEGKVRVFDSDGCSEINWPLSITVEPLGIAGAEATPLSRSEDPAGRSSVMADTKMSQATGLQARYDYNNKLLMRAIEAEDVERTTLLQGKIDGLLKEAVEKGVDLKMVEQDETEPEAEAADDAPNELEGEPQQQAATPAKAQMKKTPVIGTVAKTPAAAPAGTAPKSPATTKKPPSVVGAERAAAMSALDKGKQKKADPAAAKAAPKPRSTHDCLCGCGKETLSLFAPGHDARVKGIILKVERGDLDRDAIPDLCQPFVSLKGKWKTDGFTLTKSPVRIPGRPEVEHTGLAAMEALDV